MYEGEANEPPPPPCVGMARREIPYPRPLPRARGRGGDRVGQRWEGQALAASMMRAGQAPPLQVSAVPRL